MCADVVDDLEAVRCANENRLRQLTDTSELGHGLTIDHPDVKQLQNLVDALIAAEHQAVLNLQRAMRKHPLGPWVKAHNGIGEKQAARLLASIGDPYWNDLYDRPRTVRELYSFCGYGVVELGAAQLHRDSQHATDGTTTLDPAQKFADSHVWCGGVTQRDTSSQTATDSHRMLAVGVAPHRRKGEKVTWSTDARKRIWLIADKCIMVTSSPYREVYEKGRAQYADAIHKVECKQCGPKGKPALPGSPLSAGHQHARARRLIAKQILKDLWREAKRLHELHAAQMAPDSQGSGGGVDTNFPDAHHSVDDHVANGDGDPNFLSTQVQDGSHAARGAEDSDFPDTHVWCDTARSPTMSGI